MSDLEERPRDFVYIEATQALNVYLIDLENPNA